MKSPLMKSTSLTLTFVLAGLLCSNASAQETAPAAPATVPAAEAASQPAPTVEPALKFEYERFEYGTVEQGDKVTVTFPFKNVSDRTITIDNIRASCGCTVPELEKKVFAPGESDVIKATFDSARRQGVNTKTITVNTDDAGKQAYILSFTGEVLVSVSLQTPMLAFEEVDQGTSVTKETAIINVSGKPLTIGQVVSSKESLLVTVGKSEPYTDEKTKKTGERIPVSVTVPDSLPAGNIDGNVTINTDSANVPVLTLPIRGLVRGELVAQPSKVFFGTVPPETESRRRIILTGKKERTFTAESITVAPLIGAQEVAVSFEAVKAPEGRPGSGALDLTMIAPKQMGSSSGDLHIDGKLGDEAFRLTIPYNVFVRETPNPAATIQSTPTAVPAQPGERQQEIERLRQNLKSKIEERRNNPSAANTGS